MYKELSNIIDNLYWWNWTKVTYDIIITYSYKLTPAALYPKVVPKGLSCLYWAKRSEDEVSEPRA